MIVYMISYEIIELNPLEPSSVYFVIYVSTNSRPDQSNLCAHTYMFLIT